MVDVEFEFDDDNNNDDGDGVDNVGDVVVIIDRIVFNGDPDAWS